MTLFQQSSARQSTWLHSDRCNGPSESAHDHRRSHGSSGLDPFALFLPMTIHSLHRSVTLSVCSRPRTDDHCNRGRGLEIVGWGLVTKWVLERNATKGRRLERSSQSWELYSCLERLVAMERIRDSRRLCPRYWPTPVFRDLAQYETHTQFT